MLAASILVASSSLSAASRTGPAATGGQEEVVKGAGEGTRGEDTRGEETRGLVDRLLSTQAIEPTLPPLPLAELEARGAEVGAGVRVRAG